jgi:hypothetical protein
MGEVSAKMTGLERAMARALALPVALRETAAAANKDNANEFASAVARIIPIDDDPHHDGEHLVATLAVTPGKTATGTDVTIGGPDAPYPAHLEFGHMDHGKHVPAKPYWFTTLRVLKARFRARWSRAMNKAVKVFNGNG